MSNSASLENAKKPPLSCAECRRLKLKCNRVWPCSSCEKRGLAELCPQGSLSTRPRHKPPPPTPQHVLQRIYELQSRINELETALATLQASVSTQPHPLLHSGPLPYLHKKLMRKAALEKAQELGLDPFAGSDASPESNRAEEYEDSEDIVDSLGTLSIAADGKSRFFGPTAVSEGLPSQGPEPATDIVYRTSLPVDIVALAQSFPFSSLTEAVHGAHERIRSFLPLIERAELLCNCYFSYASFVAYTVPQDEWFENLFRRLYGTRRSSRRSPHQDDATSQYQWEHVPPDEFSVFFSILALGALTDISTEPFSAEAETYYQLSRALLTRENVLTEPTLASVQALFLGSYYEGLQSQGNSSRDCWILMALSCKTAHIMGLHRDHSMFGLEELEVQRRRIIFWEIHSMDLIESLAFGRPLCLSASQTDTKMPVDIYATTNSAGEVEESFYSWKFRFCAEVLSVVGEHVLRVKTPSYASTLEADRKLREFKTSYGRSAQHETNLDANAAAQLQMMLGTRETSMLYIHRVFFAHAVSTEPIGPEKSKYGRSVVTAFESARLIVNGMQYFVRSHTEFAARLWFLWNHLLSASFVLGSIVARAPGSSLALPASALLSTVCDVLNQASIYGGRAEYMLPVVTKLRAKGYNARKEYQGGTASTSRQSSNPPEDDDELAVIGGKTRLVITRQSSLSPPASAPSPPENMAVTPTTSLNHNSHILRTNDVNYHAQEPYVQPQDVYSLFTPITPPAHVPETYWTQDAFMQNIPEVGAQPQPQLSGYPAIAYTHNPPQQLAQFAYGEDSVTPDVGSNGWQSLMRDLGV